MDRCKSVMLHEDQWHDVLRVLRSNVVWNTMRERASVDEAIEEMILQLKDIDQLPDPDQAFNDKLQDRLWDRPGRSLEV